MAKKMLIDATHAEETRVVVADGNKVEEFDFESENKRQLAGNIYLAKVTRVEPSLQAAFIDYGGNRHGFLAFSEIHPDYYQIPVADREALIAEEREMARALAEEEDERPTKRRSRGGRSRGRSRTKASKAAETAAVTTGEIDGMDVVEIDAPDVIDQPEEGLSPVFTVAETPVETPAADENGADTAAVDAPEAENAEVDTPENGPDETAQKEAENEGESSTAEAEADTADGEAAPEDIADDIDTQEVRRPRKQRARKYKIQEVIKVRQILLVQVVKEERGNKGAALTTYLSLAGRYCVLMPNTARGGGISRKITNPADRKKLKQIAGEIEVPEGAGLIVRTAGAQRTKTEIKRDYEYLQRLWEQIRELTLKSIAPAKIYEEGNLIKRSIRDLYNKEIDEVLVEGEGGYRTAKDFMKMIMPSHAKNVKLYKEPLPLFARYQVESYLTSMFNPTVQLKSGGYIVIGVTEALVAIDVNSGRATKEGSIEETALKTNLEAAEEVARQLRLRDLAGLIVIDFIDMEERKNNAAVEKRFKDRLKNDRARIQVGRISGFGLLEMSRQRLRPGMIEATTQPCPHCHGTGLLRSDDSLALSILRQLEEEGTRRRTREVLVKAPVAIANYLMNNKREHVAGIEAAYGLSVRIEGDPMLISPDYSIEKFKTATRVVPEANAPVVSVDASLMADIDDAAGADALDAQEDAAEEVPAPKKRRRRRRRRRGGGQNAEMQGDQKGAEPSGSEPSSPESARADAGNGAGADAEKQAADDIPTDSKEETEAEKDAEAAPEKKRKVTRTRRKKAETVAREEPADAAPGEGEPAAEAAPEEKPKRKPARRRKAKAAPKEDPATSEEGAETPAADAETPEKEEKPKKRAPRKRTRAKPAAKDKEKAEPSPEAEAPAPPPAAEPVAVVASAPEPETEPQPAKPKKRGWWSLGK